MRMPGFTLLTLLAATAAHAGVYLESSETEIGESGKPAITKMWFDGGRMRTERVDGSENDVMIFKSQTMYVLDPKAKSYHKFDKAAAERMGGHLAAAKKQMEEHMANMSPEQRKQMQDMMAKMGGAAAGMMGGKTPVRTLKNTGRTETVAGIKCTVWETLEDGKKEEEICAAAPYSIPGGDEIMKTFRELSTMFGSMVKDLKSMTGEGLWEDIEKINGVPILTRDFDNGKASSEMRLTVVKQTAAPATAFDVPAGYKEKKIDFGAGADNG